MEMLKQRVGTAGVSATGCRAPVAAAIPSRGVRRIAQQATQTVEAPTATAAPQTSSPAAADGTEDIYIGFAKGDYAPRAGRKGRVIKDDPRKYPGKDDMGFFLGATGGWAGGEAALSKLREQLAQEARSQSSSSTASSSSSPVPQAPEGKAPIYLGFGKDELELRKSGATGRVIVDDPRKYPNKEDLGFFLGATGGFAGGERGLRQFVEQGEIKLRDPNQPGAQSIPPVAIAGLLVLAGAGGGLLLNGVSDLGETALNTQILQAPIDNNTKVLLLGAVGLLAGAGLLGAARATVQSLEQRLVGAGEAAKKLLVAGAFWVAVFLVARTVLEL